MVGWYWGWRRRVPGMESSRRAQGTATALSRRGRAQAGSAICEGGSSQTCADTVAVLRLVAPCARSVPASA
eukprot:536055-Rhodomonas_salina.6